MRSLLCAVLLLVGCADEAVDEDGVQRLGPLGDAGSQPGDDEGLATDAGAAERDAAPMFDAAPRFDGAPGHDAAPERDMRPPDPDCALGEPCDPIRIDRFPFVDERDTQDAPAADVDAYACAPETDESGPEFFYVMDVDEPSLVRITVDDGDDVDIDLHLLDAPDPRACLARNDTEVVRALDAGTYYVVADTWVNRAGAVLSGPYTLRVELVPMMGEGDCAMVEAPIAMRWSGCDPSLDCYTADGPRGPETAFLRLPAVGPVAKEAHLVTEAEAQDFPGGWPSGARDGLDAHYRLSEQVTGYGMDRREPWAPAGEGGSRWGQGSTGRPLPVEDESWYINMHWQDRPDPGRRMIVRNLENGRAVVASAGYETGPGSNQMVGGLVEEVHDYLGTTHRDVVMIGFAVDDTLPLGPIDCRD